MTRRIELAIAERVLPSGLTLLAVRNPGVQTFACGVSLDVRPGDEPDGQSGLAHLMGECLDEGTARRSAQQLAQAVEAIGGALECSTRGGTVQCPASEARRAAQILHEVVTAPAFANQEVARVRAEMLTELKADEDDPRTVAARRFRKEVYGRHPLARNPQGTRTTVARLRPADLRAFHRRWFTPAGGYIAAAGPDEPERMLDLLQRTFGGLRGKAPAHPESPEPSLPRRAVDVHLPMAREQVHVFLGHVGIRRTHPDFYALSVMDHVLGTGPGFTSRCARKLRDEQGLCYSVSAGITASAGEEPGSFTAYIGTSPEHRQKAVAGFRQEIDRIRREPPTPAEVADVQAYLTGSFVFGLERNGNLAAYAIRARRFDLGFDFLHRYPDLIRAVTPEQVREVAERHLHPDRMVTVSAGAGQVVVV